MLRAFRTPPVESANEIVPPSAPAARAASPVEGSPQLINIPAVIGPTGGWKRSFQAGSAVRPLYSWMRRRRHPSCWPARLPHRRPSPVPQAAMSATRLARVLMGFSDSPGSLSSSACAPSGTTARAKPSFFASLSRVAACATGRTAPDSEISPKYTASAGNGASVNEETSCGWARATTCRRSARSSTTCGPAA